jgi:APA family basic amino acid/polyamine antiporter
MARKIRGFERVLDVPSLAAVAFGEIGSSVYFALGVVALFALGFTPWVLLAVGAVFGLVALSYAEGTAAIPEAGGGALFVRRAFNDLAGFLTGWLLFLDYLIVVALAVLFVPHYVGTAVGWDAITDSPWDGVTAIGVLALLAAARLLRRTSLYGIALGVAAIAFATLLTLSIMAFAWLLEPGDLRGGTDLGTSPTWGSIAFALPLATLAYTGLETVSNLAAEAREPGRTLPRSLFAGIAGAVLLTFVIALAGLAAYPVGPDGTTALGDEWIRAPVVGIAAALPSPVEAPARMIVGLTGAIVLLAAASTSISGASRLAYSLARRDMLPHLFARLNRRTLLPPAAIGVGAVVTALLLVVAEATDEPVRFLAGLYSFGILLAFTAAQLAVIRLRATEPGLERPFRAPGSVTIRGVPVPVPALVGAPLTATLLAFAIATHESAQIAGPLWLVLGIAVFVAVRMARRERVLARVTPAVGDLVPEVEGVYKRILVPVKLGDIGDEMLATAVKLAAEHDARICALHVEHVPLDRPLETNGSRESEAGREALAEARELAAEHGVEIDVRLVRARSIGEAVVEEALRQGSDLIVVGSAPRWRRQSRFFSPTVDHVLRRAPCEVMVVAFPEGVLDTTMDA